MSQPVFPFAAEGDWEADWDSHDRWQMVAGLAATPAQRLAWLEEMIALAFGAGALPRRDDTEHGDGAGL